MCYFFFFKQKTAYEMRISDWSSDVCSSDLDDPHAGGRPQLHCARRQQLYATRPLLDVHSECRSSDDDTCGAVVRRIGGARSEERRVGQECVSPCRSRWLPYH